ncbi:MAG: CapA family protein [Actinobacteria bacterium]|nr:CapA family protein [Actinomycetota bacterium]
MTSIKLVATGDAIPTRSITAVDRPDFAELVDIIRAADVAFTNIEIAFPGAGRSPSTTYHGTHMGCRPELLDDLKWMGFDIYGMANNHATDYGTDGLVGSIAELRSRDMPFAGVGHTLRQARKPVYFQTGAARVALISAGSSNARLAAAADPGEGDAGRPGIAPLRLQRIHHVARDKFTVLRELLAESGVEVDAKGTTAPGIFFAYPDRNIWGAPPEDGFALEGIHFAPDETSCIDFAVLERDVEALVDSVREAQRQSDLVLVALHCHEGRDGRWNTDASAEFLQTVSRKLVDAGAHAILGSGPHQLRGIEIYRGRPICYSLGNFIFTLETMDSFPVEVYEQVGMPPDSTAADLYDRVTGYATKKEFWDTVVPRFEFEDGELTAAELFPVTMGFGMPRGRRGCPVMASERDGREILERLSELSKPFDTRIDITASGGRTVGRLVT